MKLKNFLILNLIIITLFQFVFSLNCFAEFIDEPEEPEGEIALEEEIEDENRIYSEAAILVEKQTGKVLFGKNVYDRKYPASTTKILTAIIALERCSLDETATASEYAVDSVKAGYTNADIKVGETFTIGELLDVMMIVSANEAATIIAEHISGSVSEFANLMNEKAKEIGCLETHFVNANGEHNEDHYTTAYDLALIARYCMQNEKFRELISKKTCSLPVTEIYVNAKREEVEKLNEKNKNKKKYKPIVFEELNLERNFRNTNSLMKEDSRYYYPYCIGGKTGFTTPAKNCLVSFSDKDGFETIAVVLHAENTEDNLSARYLDTIKLFEYGYNNYTLEGILEEYKPKEEPKQSSVKTIISDVVTTIENAPEIIKNNEEVERAIKMIIVGLILLSIVIIYYLYKFIRKMRSSARVKEN